MIKLLNILKLIIKFLDKSKWLFVTIVAYAIIYFPIFVIALLSFNESSRSYKFTGFTFKWYKEIVMDEILFEAIINTLKIAIYSTALAVIIGTLTAIGINSLKRRFRVQFMILNNIPVINPDIVTGIGLMIVFGIISLEFGQ